MKKAMLSACLLAAALGVSANAQDNTVTTQTKVKADDARTVFLKGCLMQAPGSSVFMLHNATAVTGEDLKTKTQVKTDVDDDKTKVETKSTAKIDDADNKAIGTSGIASVYEVSPNSGVNLASHVGHMVQISAVMVDAGKGDADIKVETRTKVDNDDAPDAKGKTTTKAEIPKGATARLTAMSVTGSSETCTQ